MWWRPAAYISLVCLDLSFTCDAGWLATLSSVKWTDSSGSSSNSELCHQATSQAVSCVFIVMVSHVV